MFYEFLNSEGKLVPDRSIDGKKSKATSPAVILQKLLRAKVEQTQALTCWALVLIDLYDFIARNYPQDNQICKR